MKGFLSQGLHWGYGLFLAICNVTFALIFSVSSALAEPVTVVALGDSLAAGYGLPPEEGLVPQLQGWLDAQGVDAQVQNAGVSGDTTAGGRARLDWALGPDADALIVALGGNDMLRGLPPSEARGNLEAILTAAQARGVPVLLVGMTAPQNYGPDYKTEFDAIYPDLAARHGTMLLPDFFDGFRIAGAEMTDPATYAGWMQPDGLHPNAKGVALIVTALGPRVQQLVALARP